MSFTSMLSNSCFLPLIQFWYTVVFLSKGCPDVIKKLARLPFFNEPILLDCPSIFAGIIVSASSALSLSNPYCIALIKFVFNKAGDFKPFVVIENSILWSARTFRLIGFWFHLLH